MKIGTPPRDSSGRAQNYIDPAASPDLAEAGIWFAYRAIGDGWTYAGAHPSRAAAIEAVGLSPIDDQP